MIFDNLPPRFSPAAARETLRQRLTLCIDSGDSTDLLHDEIRAAIQLACTDADPCRSPESWASWCARVYGFTLMVNPSPIHR